MAGACQAFSSYPRMCIVNKPFIFHSKLIGGKNLRQATTSITRGQIQAMETQQVSASR